MGFAFVVAAVFQTCFADRALAAAQTDVTIDDKLGVAWNDELVHYRLELPAGELKGAAIARVKLKKGDQVPSQTDGVTRHGDGSIKSMNVWFRASVPANGAASFEIRAGEKSSEAPVDAVKIGVGKDTLELSTRSPKPIAIRVPAGSKSFEFPVSVASVPGPIQGLTLPSGATIGAGRWEVPFRVKSWATTIDAEGPLFVQSTTRYVFDNGYWSFTARMEAGSSVIRVSEEFDTGSSGLAWDRMDRFYSLVVNGDKFKPSQVFFSGRNDRPEQADLFNAVIPEDAVKKYEIREGWFNSQITGYGPTFNSDRDDFYFQGFPSNLPRVGTLCRFRSDTDAIGFVTMNVADWRNPMSLRCRSNKRGELLMSLPIQMYVQGWPSDGFGGGSPNYTGITLFVPPTTSRRTYGIALTPAEDEKTNLLATLFAAHVKLGYHPLDVVKDWTLDWPDPMAKENWAEKTSEAGVKALAALRKRAGIARRFGTLARVSMANQYDFAKNDYPAILAVINSPKDLTAADRKEARRLAAFNAYEMHMIDTFPWGAGFHLNNPNMSVMAIEGRVKAALLVKDHPEFQRWGKFSADLLAETFKRFSRESGAMYENPHYSLGVTLAWGVEVAQLMIDNGLPDALASDLFKKNVLFILNWLTPPDPRFLNARMVIPSGNCSYQSVPPALPTLLINYYKQSDPKLAGNIQWWANSTYPEDKKLKIIQDIDPKLGSARFEDYGVFFRHGAGTEYETMMHFFAGNCDGHCEWEADQMTYTLYGKGQPVNLHFGNGYFPMFCRPWLRNRVSIDHKYEIAERNQTNVTHAYFNPYTEYARAFRTTDQIRAIAGDYPALTPNNQWSPEEQKNWPAAPQNIETIPLTVWYRQILFLKDPDPKGPNYFVIRDAFGGTPTRQTDLSLWFLANAMKKEGNTYRFDGQCKADIDLFVNTPENAEPETGKYGHVQQPYGRLVGFDPKFHPEGKLGETQLFVRFKQPPGKGYLVVLYPRLKENDPPATFTRLSDQAVRVETTLSTDYVLLDPNEFNFKDDRVSFRGNSASVRFFKNGSIVVVNNEGKASITVAGKVITGDGEFTVTLKDGNAKVDAKPGSAVEIK